MEVCYAVYVPANHRPGSGDVQSRWGAHPSVTRAWPLVTARHRGENPPRGRVSTGVIVADATHERVRAGTRRRTLAGVGTGCLALNGD